MSKINDAIHVIKFQFEGSIPMAKFLKLFPKETLDELIKSGEAKTTPSSVYLTPSGHTVSDMFA